MSRILDRSPLRGMRDMVWYYAELSRIAFSLGWVTTVVQRQHSSVLDFSLFLFAFLKEIQFVSDGWGRAYV
jgi:hypothetical protein